MEWQQLQQEAERYQLQLLTTEKLKKQQITIDQQIVHIKSDIRNYEQQLMNARNQLHKFERFSFINLFRDWSGKKDELREEHFDEIAVNELKLIEAQLIEEDLKDDLVDVIQKVNAINEPYVQEQLKILERKKQFWLMANASTVAEQLTKIMVEEFVVKQLLIEIQEAIEAGNVAVSMLTKAAKALKGAGSYSTWDTFFGGGFIVTALKHDKLDESNASLHKAQMALQRFQNELVDIQEMKQNALNVEVDGFVKFADYFFDDIFSAWSIHSKIATSTNQISRVLDDVRNTLANLQTKMTLATEKEQHILQQKQQIYKTEDESLFFTR